MSGRACAVTSEPETTIHHLTLTSRAWLNRLKAHGAFT